MTIDYNNGKIYTIRTHVEPDLIYVGSTCSPLHKRFYEHRKDYKVWIEGKGAYTSSFKVINHYDAYIELHELFPCNSKSELVKREGEVIRSIECVNKVVPGRSKAEWVVQNKDKVEALRKEWISQNKEKIQLKTKEYRLLNKDKIKAMRSTLKHCDICDCEVATSGFKPHLKSKKHLANLAIASESNN